MHRLVICTLFASVFSIVSCAQPVHSDQERSPNLVLSFTSLDGNLSVGPDSELTVSVNAVELPETVQADQTVELNVPDGNVAISAISSGLYAGFETFSVKPGSITEGVVTLSSELLNETVASELVVDEVNQAGTWSDPTSLSLRLVDNEGRAIGLDAGYAVTLEKIQEGSYQIGRGGYAFGRTLFLEGEFKLLESEVISALDPSRFVSRVLEVHDIGEFQISIEGVDRKSGLPIAGKALIRIDSDSADL